MSTWVQHIKNTQKKLGCTYGEAMKPAAKTWHAAATGGGKKKKTPKKKAGGPIISQILRMYPKKTLGGKRKKAKKGGNYTSERLPTSLSMEFEPKRLLTSYIKNAQKNVFSNTTQGASSIANTPYGAQTIGGMIKKAAMQNWINTHP